MNTSQGLDQPDEASPREVELEPGAEFVILEESKDPPNLIALMRGEQFVDMMPLAKVVSLKKLKVYRMLTTLPQSNYFLHDEKELEAKLSLAKARRYLSVLTIVNERYRSPALH